MMHITKNGYFMWMDKGWHSMFGLYQHPIPERRDYPWDHVAWILLECN